MPKNKKLREDVLKVTEGLLESVVDFTLYLSFWGIEFLFVTDKRYRAADQSYIEDALELINYKTIKTAINNARKEGWMVPAGERRKVNPQITAAGKKRLEERLPFYDEERVWDKVLHIVTYDISEEQKKDREILREKLQLIGCGMLQKSVWITPYNPRDTLSEFIQERKLSGAIVISSLGKDGSIGEESVGDLVYKVYGLEGLNKRYGQFLQKYGRANKQIFSAIFLYLSILQDDPQLPFELLPDDWQGREAYKVYRSYIAMLKKQRAKNQ